MVYMQLKYYECMLCTDTPTYTCTDSEQITSILGLTSWLKIEVATVPFQSVLHCKTSYDEFVK